MKQIYSALLLLLMAFPGLAQSPTLPALNFNVFLKNGATMYNNETDGGFACGGDLTIANNYQVSIQTVGTFKVNNVPVTLVVGGKVNYSGGNQFQVNNSGYVKIGDPTNSYIWYLDQNNAYSPIRITPGNNYNGSPMISLSNNAQYFGNLTTPYNGDVSATNNPIFQSNVIDFNSAFTTMQASSLNISGCADNADLRDANENPIPHTNLPNQVKISLNTGINILNITAADMNNVTNFTFIGTQADANHVLIVNVNAPGSFNWNTWNNGGHGGLTNCQYILYNFYNTTSLTIGGGNAVEGTVFAPFADISKLSNQANVEGQVIGLSYAQNGGENHQAVFAPTLTGCGTPLSASFNINTANQCLTGNSYTFTSTSTGTAPLTYAWTFGDGGTAATANATHTYAAAGTYNVKLKVTSGTGVDSVTQVVTVSQITTSLSVTNVTTQGGSNGAIDLTVSGGTAPYTYSWSNSATTQDLTNITAGVYTVTVTDAHNCTATDGASVQQPYSCSGFRTQTQGGWGATPNGNNNGVYLHANFAGAFPTGLQIGCNDLLKLTTAQSVTDFLPSGSTASALPSGTLTNPGSAYNNVLAGQLVALTLNVRFDEYDVNFGSSSVNLKDLNIASGTFAGWTVQQVLDTANRKIGGCSSAYSFSQLNSIATSINESYDNGASTGNLLVCPYSLLTTQTNVTCFGGNNGAINLTVNGGTAPYDYAWSNSATTQDIGGLTAGTYTVTVTDANNLVRTTSVTITEPAQVNASASNNGPICENATLNLIGNSTTTGATYSWTGPNNFTSSLQSPSIANATSAAVGTYTLTVSKNGCSTTATTTPVIYALPNASASNNGPICAGSTLTLTGSTSTIGATYSWTGPNSFSSTSLSPSINNATTADSGVYTLTVTKNGCSATASTTATVKAVPANVTAGNNGPVCAGATLNLTSSSTTSGVTYSWSGPNSFTSTSQNPTTTAVAGTYTVTISKNGCSAQASTSPTVNEAPANVTAGNNGPVCEGATLNLTSSSTTSGVTYSWSGPNSFTSTTQNPSTTAVAGTYTVTISKNGCSASASTTPTVNAAPANVTAGNNGPVCDGATLNLTSSSTTSGVTYSWSGPNSFTSALQNSSTTAVAGTYTVTISKNGCSAQASTTPSIGETPANVTAGNNGPVCEGATFNLTSSSTTSGVTYSWSGPGSFTSAIQNPTATGVSGGGTYTVTVSKNGCTATATTTPTVNAAPANVSANNNGPICEGSTLNLTGSSTTSGASYSWSGPNTFTSSTQNPSIANAPAAATGTYTLTVTKNGCSATATTIATVNEIPMNVTANNNGPICEGSTLNLTGSTTTMGASYSWTGPNTFTSSVQNPSIASATMAANGTYTLTVTKNGCSAAATTTATINEIPAGLSASSNSPICAGQTLTFSGSSTTSGVTYAWSGPNSFTSATQNPSIANATTAATGTYTLTVSKNGCSATATTPVTVNSCNTTDAGFTVNMASQCLTGNSYVFTNTSTGTGPLTYAWDFGDATTSTSTSPTKVYASAGVYTVTLIANGPAGADTATQTVTVTACSPTVASFTINDTAQCLSGNTFQFTSTSTGTAPLTYSWNFGDATTSTQQNPTKTYSAQGTYTVTLTVTGMGGSNSTSKSVVVYPAATSGFTINNDTQPLTGNSFVFTTTGSTSGNTYSWNFGDANTSSAVSPTHSYAAVGMYNVKQIVTNAGGCMDSTTQPVYVISDSVGGGGGGGIESESMGGLVTRRDFNRQKFSIDTRVNYELLPIFAYNMLAKTTGAAQELPDMMPAELVPGNVLRTSSPTDLLSITAAKDVLSVDYTVNNQAKAVVLGIKTLDKAYNHTKSICDRFRGAELLGVDTVSIKGFDFIRFMLKQDDGTVEYATVFVAGKKAGRSTYSLQTNWLLSQYALDDTLYNFQVWAARPDHTIKLVGDILDKLAEARPLDQINNVELPKAYVVSGVRKKENLIVKINNTTTSGNAKIVFETHQNEQSGATTLEVPVTLVAGMNEFNIAIKDGYDFEGKMYLDNVLSDEVYLADGNWGLDYDQKYTSVTVYKTENHADRLYMDDEFPLYRSVGLSALTDDYISLYKAVRPGTEKADLTDYRSLKFFAKGKGTVEIKLTRDSIVDWKSQYKTVVTLEETGKDHEISFDDFYSDRIKNDFYPKDIKTIVFTFLAGNGRKEVINFNVDNVAFSKKTVLSKRGLESKAITITPNPTDGKFQCHFSSEEERMLDLTITDVTGKVLYTQTVQAMVGDNAVPVDLKTSASVVLISITGKDVKYEVQKLMIH